MKKPINILIVLSVLIISYACDDILEEDISNDIVIITSPTEGNVIEGNTVNFSWQGLDGADDYRVQVLTNSQIFEIDSLVSSTNLEYVLNPGDYQWRIRGENFAYETSYTFPANFSIVASNDLSGQTISLQTPSADLYTNDINIFYTWNAIANADSYSFEFLKNLEGLQTVVQENDIATTSYEVMADIYDEDSEYIWRVKAINTTSESPFSERSVFIDRIVPNQPALVSPLDMEATTSVVTFNWVNGTDTGNIQSTIINTIEISSDIDFNSIIQTDTTANNTYQYTFATLGTYYWRVMSIDAASNESDYSIVRSLIVE